MGSAMAQWEQDSKDRKSKAVIAIITLMRAQSVHYVSVTYEGSGDSGSIEELTALLAPEDGTLLEPTDYHGVDVDEPGTQRLEQHCINPEFIEKHKDVLCCTEPVSFLQAIEYLAAYVTPDGYENNDGGQGVLIFDSKAGECRCEHGSNYTETSYETESISMPEEEADAEVQS